MLIGNRGNGNPNSLADMLSVFFFSKVNFFFKVNILLKYKSIGLFGTNLENFNIKVKNSINDLREGKITKLFK